MKRPLIQEYKDYVTYNHAITAKPQVRAEWNWNHTSKLSLEQRKGVYAQMHVMPTGGWPAPSGLGGTWTAIGEGWTTTQKAEAFNMTFQFEAYETGVYQFYSTSDDAHEWYITDSNGIEQLLTKYHGARQAVAYPNFSENTTFALTPGKYTMRFKVYEGNVAYDFSIGYRTPSQIATGNTIIQRIDGESAILPGETGPKHNPEPYTPTGSTQGVSEWVQDREYFPMDSII